MICLN